VKVKPLSAKPNIGEPQAIDELKKEAAATNAILHVTC
jgi:hypothetical protein